MFPGQPNDIIAAAEKVMQDACQRLVDEGVSPEVAKATVEKNLDRVNRDPNLALTVDELCKLPS